MLSPGLLQFCVQDCCTFERELRLKGQPVDVGAYLRVIGAKFLLEVCGAAGAVWGTADVLTLRRSYVTIESVRLVAIFTAVVFGVRFWWHAKHYFQHERDFPPIKLNHRRVNRLPFLQFFGTKFILEVLGGTGAIWGCAEALTLRDGKNQGDWRIAAAVVGAMFAIRLQFQLLAYCLCLASVWSDPSSILMTMIRWYEVLFVKLILEVFGSVGAVWGFSEIVWVRNADTVALWRPLSLATGVVFAGRWLRHVLSFARDERKAAHSADLIQPKDTSPDEIEDLQFEISDQALAEIASTQTPPRTARSYHNDTPQTIPDTPTLVERSYHNDSPQNVPETPPLAGRSYETGAPKNEPETLPLAVTSYHPYTSQTLPETPPFERRYGRVARAC